MRDGILLRSFYARDTVVVARDILGRVLVRLLDGQRLSGIIVEAEAYCGEGDEGCHAHAGLTPRTATLFGPPGHAYVYFTYGMHHLFNVVTEEDGVAGGVLVRALHPLEGIETMRAHRPGRRDRELTNGPAKLCAACAIDKSLNGADLVAGDEIWLEEGEPVPDERVLVGRRIGLNVGEEARSQLWRFAVADDPWVSPPRPTLPFARGGLASKCR